MMMIFPGEATLNLRPSCNSSVTAPRLHLLTGPTAVGKTALALAWAERHDAEILNADSLCFYEGMDIGTAKPSRAERARVPHHLIDIQPPQVGMTIADYVTAARVVVDTLLSRERQILVVGGSGFFLQSFFTPVVDNLRISAAIQTEVARIWAQNGLQGVQDALLQADPDASQAIDLQNPPRVIRALERVRETGQSVAELRAAMMTQGTPFDDFERKLVCLERPTEDLNMRIGQRAKAMLAEGLVEEVRRLRAQGFEANPSAARAIGYRETLAYLDAGGSEEALIAEIAQHTRQLVRKQRKWFRHQLPAHAVKHPDETSVAELFA